MAQLNVGDYPIDAGTTSGTDLADRLNRLYAATLSSYQGDARPSSATDGMIWVYQDDVTGNNQVMMYQDGSDVLIATVTPAGVVSFANSMTANQITSAIAAAETRVSNNYIGDVLAGDGIRVSLTGTGSGDATISHGLTSSASPASNTGTTVLQSLGIDSFGHVTSRSSLNLADSFYTKTAGDARYLQLTGGILTGPLSIDFGDTSSNPSFRVGDLSLYIDSSGRASWQLGTTRAAIISPQGTGTPHAHSLITREKGDARYVRQPGIVAVGVAVASDIGVSTSGADCLVTSRGTISSAVRGVGNGRIVFTWDDPGYDPIVIVSLESTSEVKLVQAASITRTGCITQHRDSDDGDYKQGRVHVAVF